MVDYIIVQPELPQSNFLEQLVHHFPALKSVLPEWDGLIHLQVARWAVYANACIENRNKDQVDLLFAFYLQAIERVDTETENALYVSFLEPLEFPDYTEEEIRQLLPSPYFEVWQDLRKMQGIHD